MGVTAAAYAIDATPGTRWTTNVPRELGQSFELDFGKPVNLRSLELNTELFPAASPSLVSVDFDSSPVAFAPTSPKPGVLPSNSKASAVRVARVIAE